MTPEALKETIRLHGLWLTNDAAGARANLSGANLSGANLSGANLSGANLRRADLREGLKAGRWLGTASRGDFYLFHMFETDSGEPFIFAGCRMMLLSEYHAHIAAEYPGTPKAEATLRCLDYLAALKPV